MANIVKLNYTASEIDEKLGKIDDISSRVEEVQIVCVAKNQGKANAGKALVVGGDGNVTLSDKTSQLEKRVTNLEQGIVPSPFEIDSTVAYSKIVPENALPYAEVSKIGGMTRKCTNLIPFEVREYTHYGVTFKVNSDGIITANGTAEGGTAVFSFKKIFLKAATSYFISSGCADGNNETYQMWAMSDNGAFANVYNIGYGATIVPTSDGTVNVYIYVYNGTTVSNLVFKPMLNEGTTALPYEPYFEGLRSAPVTEVESKGVNGVISTFPIPESVQALDGYGWGINESVYNYVDWNKKQFVKRVNQTIIDNVKEVSTSYSNVKYFAISKPLNFIGYNGTSNSFIVPKFDTFQSDWDKADNIGKVTGFASYTSFYFGFPIGTTFEEAKSALIGLPVLYELTTPVITDISDILSDDNYIAVEGGGTVTMINEFEYAVPSEITYQIKGDA